MKNDYSIRWSNTARPLGTLFAIALGFLAVSTPLQAVDEVGSKLAIQTDSTSGATPGGSGGVGGDIIVFDIVDSLAKEATDRPAGGGGDGGDIIVFDVIDSVAVSGRPAGGGGGDIIVFDIIDSAARSDRPAGGGGQDIIVFDIVDSVAAIYIRTEASSPGVYEAVLVEGDRALAGYVTFKETSKGVIVLSFRF